MQPSNQRFLPLPARLIFAAGIVCLLAVLAACDDAAAPAPVDSATRSGAPEPSSLGSAAAGSSSSASSAMGVPGAAPATKARNVILIFVDAMRADMPWQGYDRPIAPNLTKLADESVVYPRFYSVSSYTAKVMGAVLSGRYPSTLFRGATFFTEYTKANLFFPELLQTGGIRTMAVQAHGYFERDANLDQGMDVWKVVPGLKWNAETDENVTGPKMNELAMELLGDAANTSKPFFFWLHYMDPHDKYVVHEGVPRFGRNARDLYDGEIFFTDRLIGELLDFCRKQPWWDNTVVIISGDHGEAFGEHNQWKHAFALWEVLTRVPFMVHGAGVKPRRIAERRSHIDVAPTIVELAGLPPHDAFAGKSLVPELFGAEPDDREPIMLDLPADTYNPPTRAILVGDFKLLEDPGPKYKLFNLKDDPAEERNLAGVKQYEGTLADMRKRFDEAWSRHVYVAPHGGQKLVGGRKADGPKGPPGWQEPEAKDKR